ATRTRRVKTDRRGAPTLPEGGRVGADPAGHRPSAPPRGGRGALVVRGAPGRTRGRDISVVPALPPRGGGAGGPGGQTAPVPPPPAQAAIAPLVALLAPLNEGIAAANADMVRRQAADAVATRLTTTPGVGPVTAVAYVAALDDVRRFGRPGQVAAYIGLVPRE